MKFRYWVRETGKTPVDETFKEHLAWKKSYLPPEKLEIRREALRWYYREGRRRMSMHSGQMRTTKEAENGDAPAAESAPFLSEKTAEHVPQRAFFQTRARIAHTPRTAAGTA